MKDLARRVRAEAKDDRLGLLAAGVAFYATLAVFPMMITLVTVYGLFADPARVKPQIEPVTRLLPTEAADLLTGQLSAVASAGDGRLTIGLIASLITAVWAASGGVKALITGINAVHGQRERRGFLRLRALSLGLTLGAIVVAIVALLLVAAFPPVVRALNLGRTDRVGAEVLRWLLLAGIVWLALSVFYWTGPSREQARFRWFSWGQLAAVVVWLLSSIGFSLFVGAFGTFNETYGTLAAGIILMLWLYLSAYIVLLGAEIDVELDRRDGPGRVMSGGREPGGPPRGDH